jgi:hypothetical protein
MDASLDFEIAYDNTEPMADRPSRPGETGPWREVDFAKIDFLSTAQRNQHMLEAAAMVGIPTTDTVGVVDLVIAERLFAFCAFEAALAEKQTGDAGRWADYLTRFRDALADEYRFHYTDDAKEGPWQDIETAIKLIEAQAAAQGRGQTKPPGPSSLSR